MDRFSFATAPTDPASRLHWYCRWLRDEGCVVHVLIPERLRQKEAAILATLGQSIPVWYVEGKSIPRLTWPIHGHVWLINGSRLPMINFTGAMSEVRRKVSDILVFGPPTQISTARYAETVWVNDDHEVVRFHRYYDDSPQFIDPWTGEASYMVFDSQCAPAVTSHVLMGGWGLDTIGVITRRFLVRWSDSSCEFSVFESAGLFQGPIETDLSVSISGQEDDRFGDFNSDWSQGVSASESNFSHILNVSQSTPATTDGNDHVFRRWFYLAGKRIFDFTSSLIGLLLLSPMLLVIAAFVKITSRGPIFFRHKRQGLGGKEFSCLKFRSMTQGAMELQDQLQKVNEVDGPQFKIAHDPRLTKIGGWLRRYNVDELPQLFNVLMGQMSLVGPRPSPDEENQICPAWRRSRLSVKPGITGLWQVLRRREQPESDFQEWIYYDVEYAKHCSFWLDLLILWNTPNAMFAPYRLKKFITRIRQHGICPHSEEIHQADGSK